VSVEENKQVALDFFECLSNGDLEGALALIDEDVTWWLAGKPDQFEIAGFKTKTQFAEMLGTIETGMPNGIRLTITGVTAEGDRVAVEMNANGVSATGKRYENEYHDLLEIRGGKIVAGREYLDTAHAAEVIISSAKAAATAE
jgi:ketosteroid isomerase-like protein